MKKKPTFKLGDIVRPKPEWIGSMAPLPTGRIVQFEMAGQALHIEGERIVTGSYVFDRINLLTCEFCGEKVTQVEVMP